MEDLTEHCRKLERLYGGAPINEYYAPRLRIEKGSTVLEIDVAPKMLHAAHAVHGSVYFKALDDAAFFAANSYITDVFVLTTSFTIYFMRPMDRGTLISRGRVTRRTRRLLFAESTLEDDQGNELSRGSGIFMPSTIRLDGGVGYE